MLILGLTGGICSGKSSVTKNLREIYGIAFLDADKIGHEVYEPGTSGFDILIETFGERVRGADGKIDRKELGSIVFADKAQMKKLQEIVWPEIRKLIIQKLDALRSAGTEAVVVEAAVMIEAHWEDLMTKLWVVEIDPEVAKQRLMERNGLSAEQADQRISAQLSNEERRLHADLVLTNSGTMEELRDRVCKEFDLLIASRS